MQKLDEIKDLGVIMDNRLNFSSQITAVISKAKQRLYLLRKCFVACTVDKQIHGFKVYILPILDYCSPVWTPHCDKDIIRLESVQRLFTKRLPGYENLTYAERLVKAGLCSLELRRLRADLCLCYKIVHSQIHLDSFFTRIDAGPTRGHSLKLKAAAPRLDTKRYFFAYRISIVWNFLKDETVCSETLAQFKVNLSSGDSSTMLICF